MHHTLAVLDVLAVASAVMAFVLGHFYVTVASFIGSAAVTFVLARVITTKTRAAFLSTSLLKLHDEFAQTVAASPNKYDDLALAFLDYVQAWAAKEEITLTEAEKATAAAHGQTLPVLVAAGAAKSAAAPKQSLFDHDGRPSKL